MLEHEMRRQVGGNEEHTMAHSACHPHGCMCVQFSSHEVPHHPESQTTVVVVVVCWLLNVQATRECMSGTDLL